MCIHLACRDVARVRLVELLSHLLIQINRVGEACIVLWWHRRPQERSHARALYLSVVVSAKSQALLQEVGGACWCTDCLLVLHWLQSIHVSHQVLLHDHLLLHRLHSTHASSTYLFSKEVGITCICLRSHHKILLVQIGVMAQVNWSVVGHIVPVESIAVMHIFSKMRRWMHHRIGCGAETGWWLKWLHLVVARHLDLVLVRLNVAVHLTK